MSREIYLEGYYVGRTVANKLKAPIIAARQALDLGLVAGYHLDKCRKDPHFIVTQTFAKTESFGEGFFDGFIDRADEIRE